jgi:hypothetical protein
MTLTGSTLVLIDDNKGGGKMEIGRKASRLSVSAEVQLRTPGNLNQAVQVRDLSKTGCCIDVINRVRPNDRLWVKFSGLEALECVVCWEKEFVAGVEFVRPLHPAVLDTLLKRLKT